MKLDVYRLFVMSLFQEESAPLLTFVSGLNKRRNSHEVNHSVAVLAFRSIHKIFEQRASFRRNLIHLQEWSTQMNSSKFWRFFRPAVLALSSTTLTLKSETVQKNP